MLDDIDELLGTSGPRSSTVAGLSGPVAPLPTEMDERVLADLLRLSLSMVRTKAREGVFVRSSRGRYDVALSVGNYVERLREGAARAGRPASADSDNLKAEKLRLTKAQADKEETRVQKERGELVPVADTLREWQAILRDVRAAMLAVPSRFASTQPHLTPHDIAALTDEIKRSLEGLADGND